MPVFEAILVAILVFTAMLFVTSIQKPTLGRGATGIDLNTLAADTLDNLAEKNFKHPSTSENLVLEDWVRLALEDDGDVESLVHDYMKDVLGAGHRYKLTLENGYGAFELLPPDESITPRGGGAAQSFLFPNWTIHQSETPNATAIVFPGEALDFSAWTTLTSPTNTTVAPDGGTWLAWWDAKESGTPDKGHVPAEVLYGTWKYDDGGACPCYVHVALPGGVANDHPVYALRLVVWLGA